MLPDEQIWRIHFSQPDWIHVAGARWGKSNLSMWWKSLPNHWMWRWFLNIWKIRCDLSTERQLQFSHGHQVHLFFISHFYKVIVWCCSKLFSVCQKLSSGCGRSSQELRKPLIQSRNSSAHLHLIFEKIQLIFPERYLQIEWCFDGKICIVLWGD